MERYEVFYKETRIGILTADPESGKHRYVPDRQGVAAVEAEAGLTEQMKEATAGFVDPIPFFQNRLMNMKRWGLREINYQTDWFLLRRIEE